MQEFEEAYFPLFICPLPFALCSVCSPLPSPCCLKSPPRDLMPISPSILLPSPLHAPRLPPTMSTTHSLTHSNHQTPISFLPSPSSSPLLHHHHPIIKLTRQNPRDEFCPNCDNHFILPAKTPQAALKVESGDVRVDARMLRDDRTRETEGETVWEDKGERGGWAEIRIRGRGIWGWGGC